MKRKKNTFRRKIKSKVKEQGKDGEKKKIRGEIYEVPDNRGGEGRL